MFVGHLAVALAARPASPRVPLSTLVAAAFALDLIWPLLLLAGVEQVRIAPGITAFTPLDFEHYPWSHSLVMALVWGAVAATFWTVRGKRAAAGVLVGVVVVSHWILDWVTHRPDLPLWPGGPHVGLGLWNSVAGTFLVEGALFAAAILIYVRSTRPRSAAGRWSLVSLIVFTTLIWASGPFSPPPPSTTAIATVGLAMLLFPVWGAWIERTRDVRS